MAVYISKSKTDGSRRWYEVTADLDPDIVFAASLYQARLQRKGGKAWAEIDERQRARYSMWEKELKPNEKASGRWKRIQIPGRK
jgi:hypothetical protein